MTTGGDCHGAPPEVLQILHTSRGDGPPMLPVTALAPPQKWKEGTPARRRVRRHRCVRTPLCVSLALQSSICPRCARVRAPRSRSRPLLFVGRCKHASDHESKNMSCAPARRWQGTKAGRSSMRPCTQRAAPVLTTAREKPPCCRRHMRVEDRERARSTRSAVSLRSSISATATTARCSS